MPFVDVGTTSRRKMTPTRALKAWENYGGQCVNCGEPIDGTKQRWFVEHIRALELGGSDDHPNLGPAHLACKKAKDADDHSRAAKAKRAKRQQLGIRPATLNGQGFPKYEPKRRATTPVEKLAIAYRRNPS